MKNYKEIRSNAIETNANKNVITFNGKLQNFEFSVEWKW